MRLPDDITWRLLGMEDAGDWEWVLSDEEKARRASFRDPGRRREFTLGRVAARRLLGERLALAPANVPLRVAADGGVDVAGCGGALHVSIAHSSVRAVAAVAPCAVGVDLERIVPRHRELHRFLLHPDEYPLLETLGLDRVRTHILCWTLKEATLKALRTGFRLSPKKLRLDVDPEAGRALVSVEGEGRWEVRFEEREGFYVAVAFPGG